LRSARLPLTLLICALIVTILMLRGEVLVQKDPVTAGNNWGDVTAFAGVAVQALATIFSLTISIPLVVLQIASELYTIRVHDLFFTKSIWAYLPVSSLSVIFSTIPFFPEWIRPPEWVQWTAVFLSLLAGVSCTVCYIRAIIKILRPRGLQEALGKKIDRILRELIELEEERNSYSAERERKLREDLSSYLSGLVEIARVVASRGDRMMLEDIIKMMMEKWSRCSDPERMDLFMKAYYNICLDLVSSGLTDMLSAALDLPQKTLGELDEETRVQIAERIGLACVEIAGRSTSLGLAEETGLLIKAISEIITTLKVYGEFVELKDGWIEELDILISIATLRKDDLGNQVSQIASKLKKEVAML